ncbi:hypothetical protein [Streptomyces sp. HUAS TT7]|uniref:hypothetical protein n=1 Tax=Streptomyces sp. HUAS TT7 TaxID=3447507 RepID=UPI003F65BCAF
MLTAEHGVALPINGQLLKQIRHEPIAPLDIGSDETTHVCQLPCRNALLTSVW